MKIRLLMLCACIAAPVTAASELTLLQSADVTETMRTTEGGGAELYLVSGTQAQRGRCRIEVGHYGELGKIEYIFEFGSDLNHAESRDYRYRSPIDPEHAVEIASVTIESMADGDNVSQFRELFREYKTVFEDEELRKCVEPR